MRGNSGIFVRYKGDSVLIETVPIKAIPELVRGWDVVRTTQALVRGIQEYKEYIKNNVAPNLAAELEQNDE